MSYRSGRNHGSSRSYTPSTAKPDQSMNSKSHRLSSNYRDSSYDSKVSLSHVDFSACRSPRSVNFDPIKAWAALTCGHRTFPGCSAAVLHPELKDFEWLPQALVDMGWFEKELQPLVPTTFMIKPRQLPAQSFESGQVKLWYEKPRLQKWYVYHSRARQFHFFISFTPGLSHYHFITSLGDNIVISLLC